MNKVHLRHESGNGAACGEKNNARGNSLMIVDEIQYVTCLRCK